jgi:phosphopantothenoylcysteine decarboxylase/phosphopantothenate--cysteine ligase
MGLALAAAAQRRGAQVTLIAANVSLPEPPGVRRVDVGTAAELAAAVGEEFPGSQVLLMAAAPADFRPRRAEREKIKRSGEGLDLYLEPTEDILASVAAGRAEGQIVVGFAAEHGNAARRAREKLTRKGADLIVLNDVSDPRIGFESEQNAVTLIGPEGERVLPIDSKQGIAEAILDRIDELRKGSGQRSHR